MYKHYRFACKIKDIQSGRRLECFTNQPGVLFYTGMSKICYMQILAWKQIFIFKWIWAYNHYKLLTCSCANHLWQVFTFQVMEVLKEKVVLHTQKMADFVWKLKLTPTQSIKKHFHVTQYYAQEMCTITELSTSFLISKWNINLVHCYIRIWKI